MSLCFTINRNSYTVRVEDYPADITLNTFIREYAKLFGTKFYCLEGGCGVCTVTIRSRHPVTNRYYARAANSCLTLLNVCDGWDIVTIEGLGNKKAGYHPIQERLAHFNGSQCGYCSPGMIMNMYSNLEAADGKMTMEEIENSFGGNICRCTGYRPILDAMKSFASNSDYEFVDMCADIEDLKICSKENKGCLERCRHNESIQLKDDRRWHHPRTLQEIFDIFSSLDGASYMLVAGNTAHGVYRRGTAIKVFIDINYVSELHTYVNGEVFELGANMTLTEVMKVLRQASSQSGFEYFEDIVKHLDLVAHVAVRNMGTIAGNLSIKHQHNEFPSDVFLLLTTVGAQIVIAQSPNENHVMSLPEFLKYDMDRKVIVKITLPVLNRNEFIFGSYKITPRTQNAHAYVNAGFLFHISASQIITARLCFGGINPEFIESSTTTDYLRGRNPFLNETTTHAIQLLDLELQPDWVLPDPSPEYRKRLSVGLFYKFILTNAPSGSIRANYRSGSSLLVRPLSNGMQTFDTRQNRWPINQPVRKLEAMWQCSGEAHYTNDIPHMAGEVWAAFVHAVRIPAIVAEIDPQEALNIPGVVAFFSAKDIPGRNSFVTVGMYGIVENEEIFCSSAVKFHSQAVGVILAESLYLANYAAKQVKILYEHPTERPILPTLRDVLEYKYGRNAERKWCQSIDTEKAEHTELTGHFEMGGQFHFSMETQTTVCIPREDELMLYPSSHYHSLVQVSVANALNIKENQVNMEIRRLGGSFGCKLTRSNHVAVTCALASWLSNRPVRFVQTIESNMATSGKRSGCVNFYTSTVNDRGKIQSLSINFYEDMGCALNDSPIETLTIPSIPNCYDGRNWNIESHAEITDAPSNTWFRAPGTLEGICMTENIMEHIARAVGRDPVDVRDINIPQDSPMKKLLPSFVSSTEYKERRKNIEDFNKANRWKKRGIGISLMNFGIIYIENISATVAIYHYDGTVAVTHGGVECGQGINTKVAQVVASTLGIPLEMVSIKATNSLTGANATFTGASVGSEMVCYAARKACTTLLDRMKPVRDRLTNPTWVEVVRRSFAENINLVANDIHKAGDMQEYRVWGLSCSEIEVDVLTGNFQLTRVDVLEDTGESLSPLIDVGQIEGAFTMGLSYWFTERLIYNRQNGELVNNRTWNYKVIGAKDIPIDFRVTLLQSTPNSGGFLGSKATGEVAICLSISALFALRHALDSARKDANITENWYDLGAPTTIEEILLTAGHTAADLAL